MRASATAIGLNTIISMALLSSSLSTADTIHLVNGDRLSGAVVKSDQNQVTLQTAYVKDPITLDRADILSIEPDSPTIAPTLATPATQDAEHPRYEEWLAEEPHRQWLAEQLERNPQVWQWNMPPDELPRFQPYGLNYGIWQKSQGDEAAVQAHYSFKYYVWDCQRGRENSRGDSLISSISYCDTKVHLQPSLFLSYTGEFDFYMGTRSSSPVINRSNNPALHLHALIDNGERLEQRDQISAKLRFIDFGIEHLSNGQDRSINELNSNGELETQVAYDTGDHAFFDSISRSANFASLAAGSMNSAENSYNYAVKANAYWDHDTTVNWGSKADDNVSILDYDLMQFNFKKRFSNLNLEWLPEITGGIEYTVGAKGFDTDSANFTVIAPVRLNDGAIILPFMIRAHLGPLNNLSNYTESSNSLGVGLALWY